MKRTRVGRIRPRRHRERWPLPSRPRPSTRRKAPASRPSRSSRRPPFRDVDGQYIVNGDEPVAGTGALKSYYEGMVGTARKITTRPASS